MAEPQVGGDQTPEQKDDAAFVTYLGASWAPVGAANDPRGLNANWVGNVRRLWLGTSLA